MSTHEQWALGIRYDEEDDGAGETFLVRLLPGKADVVDQLPGVALAVASAQPANKAFVLDARGVVNVDGRRHKLASPRAMVPYAHGVVLAGSDRLWVFSPDGATVKEGPAVIARKLAASAAGVVAACDDGRVVFWDGAPGSSTVREVSIEAGGQANALAIDDGGRIAAASGRTILFGDAGALAPLATAPFDVHTVAVHKERVLLASRMHGLFCVDEKKVQPLRPSLRAHSLVVRNGVLVVASDLFVAISDDGVDFLTRDLAPFVRLADQRMPKFTSTEDPLGV